MESSDLISALRKRNPAHDGPLGVAHWRLVDDAVTGQGGFLAGLRDLRVHDYGPGGVVGGSALRRVGDGETYLLQFPRETAEDFTARVRASTYDNHVAPVLRSYTGQLWSDAPVRDTSVEAVRRFWDDPDAGLGKIDAWVAQGSDAALRHGWAMALIDRPEGDRPATDPGTTGRWLDPREVADWQIDARGEVFNCGVTSYVASDGGELALVPLPAGADLRCGRLLVQPDLASSELLLLLLVSKSLQ